MVVVGGRTVLKRERDCGSQQRVALFARCSAVADRIRMPRSTFGPQAYSRRRSSSAYGFGTASREQASNASGGQSSSGTDSPGPAVYLLPASTGTKQPDARKLDPPKWVTHENVYVCVMSTRGSMTQPSLVSGNLADTPTNTASPMQAFGTAKRDQSSNDLHKHDPLRAGKDADYHPPSTIGKAHPLATVKSEPVFSFGKGSTREQGQKGTQTRRPYPHVGAQHAARMDSGGRGA